MSLVPYIKEQLKKGYDASTIKSYLLSSGYSIEEVNSAIEQAYAPPDNTKIIIIAIIIMAGLLILTAAIYYFTMLGPAPTVQCSINNLEKCNSPAKCEALGAGFEWQGNKCAAVTATPEQCSLNSPGICNKTECEALGSTAEWKNNKCTQKTITATCDLNHLGNCDTKTKCEALGNSVEWKNNKCTQKTTITPTCALNELDACNTKTKCEALGTTVEWKNNKCTQKTAADTDDTTGIAALNEITNLAKINPEQAAQRCPELRKGLLSQCYTNIADISNQSKYCEPIISDTDRDSCYLIFVTQYDDYTLCDKLISDVVKDACFELKNLAELEQKKK